MEAVTKQNRLSKMVAKFDAVPDFLRQKLISMVIGRAVPYVGTSGLFFEKVSQEEVIVSVQNKKRVQNHIQGVHAIAMALIAETATGINVGMNLPDDKIPLIKTMKIDYKKRTQGAMRAVASLTPEQRERILQEDKGEVVVPVVVTDESGGEPILCEMLWAWIPKKRKEKS